ncbi:MAG: hypothetical protein AAGG08_07360 [Actinomycetota bacterium]
MTDRGRAEVYAAEAAAFEGTDLEQVRPIEQILDLVRMVASGQWWPGPGVVAVGMRADASSSCARAVEGHVEIRIARTQATWATAAHELAHAVAGVSAGHGPTYRRAMLDVVDVVTNTAIGDRRGRVHTDQLTDAYRAHDLDVGERAWAAPTASDPFAL